MTATNLLRAYLWALTAVLYGLTAWAAMAAHVAVAVILAVAATMLAHIAAEDIPNREDW